MRGWFATSGIYLQDTWTIKRLTLNPGVRVEYFNGRMNEISVPAGRFVPGPLLPRREEPPELEKRRGAARVGGLRRVRHGQDGAEGQLEQVPRAGSHAFAALYAKAGLVNETRNWFDVDLVPGTSTRSGVAKPTDNDGIAQDSEIGRAAASNFGARAERFYDPDIKRASNIEFTAGVNHELMPQVRSRRFYYRRNFENLTSADRFKITDADYTSFHRADAERRERSDADRVDRIRTRS